MAAVHKGSSKTPQCKRSTKKVLNPLSPGSRTPGTVAFINNDEEERRQRRLDSHTRGVMSPCYSARPQSGLRGVNGGLSSLSNVQIAEHYADCIKLSSENKINSRNAFGLHLIDYMLEMLLERGELENFQVAGCTLDAGAKIYASRVDSIYTDAYKVLGGISRNDPVEHGRLDIAPPVKEKNKKELSAATVEINPKVLNLCSKDLDLEVDPFFKQMFALFDEGHEEGFMLCQLITREDYSLVLDLQSADVSVEPLHSDFNALPMTGLSKEMNSFEVCPSFSTFNIMESQNVTEFVSAESVDSGCIAVHTDLQPDYSMLPCPTTPDSDVDEVTYDPASHCLSPTPTENVEVLDPSNTPEATSIIGVCGDNNYAHVIRTKEDKCYIEHGGIFTNALHDYDYSYFDPSIISTWAGLHHWKMKSYPRNEVKSGVGSGTAKRCKPSPKVSFHDIPYEKSFQLCKPINLTLHYDEILKCTTLPQDAHLKISALLELFIHSNLKVEKKKPLIMMEEELDDSWYGGGKNKNCSGYSDSPLQIWDTTFTQSSDVEETDQSQFELVSLPKKVQNVPIGYAKCSKRIDAKYLKEKLWGLIDMKDLDHASGNPVDFGSVCSQISKHFSENVIHDLSVPICFVFLLHLANEKGLKLSGEVGLCNVVIDSK